MFHCFCCKELELKNISELRIFSCADRGSFTRHTILGLGGQTTLKKFDLNHRETVSVQNYLETMRDFSNTRFKTSEMSKLPILSCSNLIGLISEFWGKKWFLIKKNHYLVFSSGSGSLLREFRKIKKNSFLKRFREKKRGEKFFFIC